MDIIKEQLEKRLQAFTEAQETGKIAITSDTAKICANAVKMEILLQKSIDLLSDKEEADDKERINAAITGRLYDSYLAFIYAFSKEVSKYIVENSIRNFSDEFEGL